MDSSERFALREAARGALAGFDSHASARAALDGHPLPDTWAVAVSAGWPGVLVAAGAGGAGLGASEAMLISGELGRALSGVPLVGHLTATALLTGAGEDAVAALATGSPRAAWLPSRPHSDGGLTADPITGSNPSPEARIDSQGLVTGEFGWVPDVPGADLLVLAALDVHGVARGLVLDAGAAEVESVRGYDASRRLGHVRLRRVRATPLALAAGTVERTWALAQALLGAESLGAAERLLELSAEHARRRFAFGRSIGSFQAVKHQLVEVLRRIENARALRDYAGWAFEHSEPETLTSACALRHSAGDALDFAARTAIAVHGGSGATWEHPTALYFRRAQLSRRLLGGHRAAAREVGRRLLEDAGAAG